MSIEAQGEKQGFRIRDLDEAIRFAETLHEQRVEQQSIIDAADKSIQAKLAEIAVIEEWRDREVDEINTMDGGANFRAGALSLWHRELYLAKPKGNTKKTLPFTTLKRKGGTLSTEVDNSELFVKSAKDALPVLVRKTEPKPAEELPDLKAVLKEVGDDGALLRRDDGSLVVKKTGDVLEGVRVIRSAEEFVVEVQI